MLKIKIYQKKTNIPQIIYNMKIYFNFNSYVNTSGFNNLISYYKPSCNSYQKTVNPKSCLPKLLHVQGCHSLSQKIFTELPETSLSFPEFF